MVDSIIRIFLMFVFVTIGIFTIAIVLNDTVMELGLPTKCLFVSSGLVITLFGIKVGWERGRND